jgi:pyrimidine-nucleoside phosphorylase
MAVISDMSQPLGFAIGNALEVKEAIDTLKGEGPEDLTELCLTLGSHMVYLAKKADSLKEAREMLHKVINDGTALNVFKTFLASQGGDASIVDDPDKLPQAKFKFELEAKEEGYVSEIIADEVGTAAMILGAGRATKESNIDLAVGLVLRKKIGDYVAKGESLVTIYSNFENVNEVKSKLYENIRLSSKKVAPPVLIYEEITE